MFPHWIFKVLNLCFLLKHIKMDRYIIVLSFLFTNTAVFSQEGEQPDISWKKLAVMQNADESASLGYAGIVSGTHNNVLLIAGGANFPEKMPWEGGKKHYSDEIHILQKKAGEYIWNTKISKRLSEPIAYSGSTVVEKGVVYAGGENEDGISKKVYLLQWDPVKSEIEIKALPDLPYAVTNAALASIGNTVYLAGGDTEKTSTAQFLSLDLDSENPSWKILPDMPHALAYATASVQKGPDGMNVYIIGGRAKTASGISKLHNTVAVFNPRTQTWRSGSPVSDGAKVMNLSAASSVPVGENYILVPGGDNGEVFHQIETYLSKITASKSEEEKSRLTAEKNKLVIHHQGFYRGILVYNTLTDTWSKIGELPFPAQVTSKAVFWDGAVVLSSGEIKPGVRTPNIMWGTIQ